MKAFVVLSALLAIAAAKPAGLVLPLAPVAYPYVAAPAAALTTKYHSQDALGQYAYGYNDGLSAKQEVKTFDGITRGSYSYVDAKGEVQTVDYTADAVNGFRVAGTNLPKAIPAPEVALPEPVAETPEVAAARAAHLAAIEDAQSGKVEIATPVPVPNVELPRPVEDTPEVVAAREAHLAAKKEAELRNSIAEEIDSRPVIQTAPVVATSAISAPVVAAPLATSVVVPSVRYAYGIHGIPAPLTYSTNFLSYPIVH